MPTIAQVSQAMQTVLTTVADTAARTTGLVQRASKLTGALFVQTLVFGFLAHPRSTRAQLATTAAALGVEITAQAIDQRLTEPAAHCLATVLDAAAATVLVTLRVGAEQGDVENGVRRLLTGPAAELGSVDE